MHETSSGSPAAGFLAPLARWVDVMERQLQVGREGGREGPVCLYEMSSGSPAAGFLAPLARWVDVMERQLQVGREGGRDLYVCMR